MKNVSVLLAIFVSTSAPSYGQTGPTGTWRVDGVGASLPWTVVLRADGDNVVGAVSHCANNTADIYDGHIDRNTVK